MPFFLVTGFLTGVLVLVVGVVGVVVPLVVGFVVVAVVVEVVVGVVVVEVVVVVGFTSSTTGVTAVDGSGIGLVISPATYASCPGVLASGAMLKRNL